eukprot:s865_g27.t1
MAQLKTAAQDMKTAFWLSDNPIGRNIMCPRDGRAGCTLVDWIPRSERREQTHFMSWTWRYSLLQVRDALEMFQGSASSSAASASLGAHSQGVFFFMCFFVNNQYRIIVEESSTGSDNLEDVFEGNLKRIGRMVAILDNWDRPVYLSRVWTVYEQFVASTIEVQVQFVLPRAAADHLRRQIAYVPAGIDEVIKSLCQVDSRHLDLLKASRQAKAWKLADEVKDTVGFQHVDAHVTHVMITWIGDVMEQTCKQMLDKARAEAVQTPADQVFASEVARDAEPVESAEGVGTARIPSEAKRVSHEELCDATMPVAFKDRAELRAAVKAWERGPPGQEEYGLAGPETFPETWPES